MAVIDKGTDYICDICEKSVNKTDGWPDDWRRVELTGMIAYKNHQYDKLLFCADCWGFSSTSMEPERVVHRKTIAQKIMTLFKKEQP